MAHAYRDYVYDQFVTKFGIEELKAKDAEIGIYNWCIDYAEKENIIRNWKNPRFQQLYKDKAVSVIVNLDKDSYVNNVRLLDRLNEGEFLPHELAYLQRENICPERWRVLLDNKMKKDMHVIEEKPAAMTNEFRCGKCKKRECVYQELQVRSADEPMTLFITCLNCGNKWRIG
jgi:DNA-directed RNA polymerase subunit M/transcription elongation factor TFIIS